MANWNGTLLVSDSNEKVTLKFAAEMFVFIKMLKLNILLKEMKK